MPWIVFMKIFDLLANLNLKLWINTKTEKKLKTFADVSKNLNISRHKFFFKNKVQPFAFKMRSHTNSLACLVLQILVIQIGTYFDKILVKIATRFKNFTLLEITYWGLLPYEISSL